MPPIADSGDSDQARNKARTPEEVSKAREEVVWKRLSVAARGRKASKVAVQDWAADHLEIQPSEIRAETVPSPGAVSFLRWAREFPAQFYKEYYGKISAAAAKSQPTDGRLSEDGRSIPEILHQFERSRRELAELSRGGKANVR